MDPQQQSQQQMTQQVNAQRMDPPPHAVYSSFEELLSASNAHAQAQGYKLVVVRSKTNTHGMKTWVQLACDRHGTKRNTHNLTEETRKKNRRSRRCECPMFCVASRTPSALWELTVRNGDHNHERYEPPSALKRKKNQPQQHSSELVNLPLLQTPSACIADFCLIPIGTGNPSVSTEIAEVQRLLKRSGLTFTMHSAGTTLEGPWDDVMRIIGQAHSLLHGTGVARIQTTIHAGSRTDKKQTARDKIRAVEALLGNDAIDAPQQEADDDHDESQMPTDTPTHLRHMPSAMDPQISSLEHMMQQQPPPTMQMPPTLTHHPMAHMTHRLPPNLPFEAK